MIQMRFVHTNSLLWRLDILVLKAVSKLHQKIVVHIKIGICGMLQNTSRNDEVKVLRSCGSFKKTTESGIQ